MRVGVVDENWQLGKYHIVPTPAAYADGINKIAELAYDLNPEQNLIAAAGGLPGPMSPLRDKLVSAPHLSDWAHKPIQADISRIVGGPAYIENDTALVGLGEATHGAGRKSDIVAYITISTGVGGVRIVNAKLDESLFSFEIGHHILNFSPRQKLEELNHWEEFISGSGIKKRHGLDVSQITDQSFWDEVYKYLAVGIHNVMMFWSPQVIVLGGGLVSGDLINLYKVIQMMKQIPTVVPEYPGIVKAELKDIGGLYGALELLRNKLLVTGK